MTEPKAKAPRNWGQNQWVRIGFTDGKTLKGVLTGADIYDLFISLPGGAEVMVAQGAKVPARRFCWRAG